MPAGVISRPVSRGRNRKVNSEVNRPQPVTPIQIASSVKAGSVITLTFDQPVSLKGTPAYTAFGVGVAFAAISAVKTAANVVAVTFNAAITGASTLNIGFRDPAIRNASGGFVTSNSVAV